MRVLFLADDDYGANWKIEDGRHSIESTFLSWGWEVRSASPKGRVEPCAWGRAHGMLPVRTDYRTSELDEGEAWDAVVVLPGCGGTGLIGDGAALRVLRAAWKGGSVVAAFCKGARVLAAAGIVAGKRMTGHLDFAKEYREAGADYVGYLDAKGKTDAQAVVVDGRLVTGMRSNLNRTRICEAIRDAALARRGAASSRRAESGELRGFLVAYCDYAYRGVPSTPLLLLAESLRTFGGTARKAPVLVLTRKGRPDSACIPGSAGMAGVSFADYEVPEAVEEWPFAAKACAAAVAEAEAEARGLDLLWLDRDSLVTGDLARLRLPAGKDLGYRPVNLRNIGSPAGSSPDPFWARAAALAGVEPESMGRSSSYIDGEELLFYMAAGLVALRPGLGIMRRWAGLVGLLATDPEILSFRDLPKPYSVFMHQAALSLVASRLPPERRLEYGPEVMYPLNLFGRDNPERRPASIEDLVSLRYDEVFETEDWEELPMGEALRGWLSARLQAARPLPAPL